MVSMWEADVIRCCGDKNELQTVAPDPAEFDINKCLDISRKWEIYGCIKHTPFPLTEN